MKTATFFLDSLEVKLANYNQRKGFMPDSCFYVCEGEKEDAKWCARLNAQTTELYVKIEY